MHTRADSRTYVGRLEAGAQAVYVVDANGVDRVRTPGEDFAWGGDAIGRGNELARILLSDASGAEPGSDACRDFCSQILARLPHDGFALQSDTVRAWLRRTVTV